MAAVLFAFPWPVAEAQQPPFPVAPAPQQLGIEGPPALSPPPPQIPQAPQAPLYYPAPQRPFQAPVLQQPPTALPQQPAVALPQPGTGGLAGPDVKAAPGTQLLTLVEVLQVRRNLYFGFSPADYSEAGNVREDYGLPTPQPYSLKEGLNLFNFRYALQFNEHSEIVFGLSRSQEKSLDIQDGNKVDNTYTSLSISAKEKLNLPYNTAVYGYLGVSYNEFNQNISSLNTGPPLTPPELNGLSPVYGAGLEWNLTEDLGVFLEYARFYEQERRAQRSMPKALIEGFIFGAYVRF